MLGGIEAGGTKCVVAVADDDLSIIAEATIPTTAPDETFASSINFFEQAQSEHGSDLTTIGVASFTNLNLSKKMLNKKYKNKLIISGQDFTHE